jgi:hypothetical protein
MLLEHPNSNLIITKLHPMTMNAKIVTLNMTKQQCFLHKMAFLLKARRMEEAAGRVNITIGFHGILMSFPMTE